MKASNLLFIIGLLCLSVGTNAQKTQTINQLKVSKLVPVSEPLLIDSVDVNLKKFETKSLLSASLDLNKVKESTTFMHADTAGVFVLEHAPYDAKFPSRDKALQLLTFSIDADRYCKADLSITSTDMFEVYVNGKKEKSEEVFNDSLSKAKPVKITLTMEPRRHEVIIKRMVGVKNNNESMMKIGLTPEKKDSLAVLAVSTTDRRPISIYDLMDGNRVTGTTSISPSGKYYIATLTSSINGKSTRRTELRDLKTNQAIYQLPSGMSPSWAKGKDQLIYSRSNDKGKEIVTMNVPSFEETILAEGLTFDYFTLSADQKKAFLGRREEIKADNGALKRTMSVTDRSGGYRGRNSIYLHDMETGLTERITFGNRNVGVSDISKDSQKALISVYEYVPTERPFSSIAYYELDLNTLALDTLFSDPFVSRLSYSPDGKQIMAIGSGEAFGKAGENIKEGQISNMYNNQLFLLDRKTLTVDPVCKHFDPAVNSANWSPQDNHIYLTVEDKDHVAIYRFNPQSKDFQKLNLAEEVIFRFATAEQASMAVYAGQSASNATRLYSYNIKSGKSELLSDPFRSQLNEIELSPVTDWNFTSSDQTTIYGRYYLPPHFDPNKKYPMIVYYYGGTNPTSRNFESSYPGHVYAAQGYVVYVIQPSGATGFGQEFAARHVNAWGERTAEDIIEGTEKFCEEHPFVDASRIGCIGASYGGFMTQYLQTKTDLFAAAISHAGISNIASYWGEGYWGVGYSAAASAGSYPWNNPKLYTEQSPLFHADKINTPLLLLHGTVDTNVPIGESIQMYNALKILGKEVEFISVDGENHGIAAYQKRIDWSKTIYAWFAKWLKDQPEWWNSMYPERDPARQ